MAKKNSSTVSLTRKTTTKIYKLDNLNGLRSSSVTEVTEVIEVCEEIGLDPLEVRSGAEVRRFNRNARATWDSIWYGRSGRSNEMQDSDE